MRSKMHPSKISDIIGKLYDCVDSDELWAAVAAALTEFLPGSGVAIRLAPDQLSGANNFFYSGLQRDFVVPSREPKIFNKPWIDPFLRIEGRVFDDVLELDNIFDGAAFRTSGLSRAFLQPDEVFGSQAILLGPDHDFRLTLVTRGDPELARRSSRLLTELLPHVKRVRSLRCYKQCERPGEPLAYVLDLLAMGVVVIDADMTVVLANQAATQLAVRDGAIVIGDRFRCRDEEAQRRLGMAMLSFTSHSAPASGEAQVVVGRYSSAELRLVLSVLAIPPRFDGGRCLFAVFLMDFDRRPSEEGIKRLASVLGLTPAEHRLLRQFGCGDRLEQTAKTLSISTNTVRNQLRAIFAKAGVRRQADLFRLILASDGHALKG